MTETTMKSAKRLLREQDEKEGHYVEVGKGRGKPFQMFYKRHGKGPVKVLLIMGFVCSQHLWKYQVEYFAQRPEFEVVVFDNRGTGYSRYTRLDVSTSEFAEDTHELVQHLGWPQFHLLGLSMGGMISLEYASRYGDRLRSLTLCVTHAGGRYAMGVPLRGARVMLGMQLARGRRAQVQKLMELLYSDRLSSQQYADIFKWHMDTFIFHGTWPILAQQRAIASHYVTDARLAEIRSRGFPIAVMTGTNDALVNPKNSEILARALQADLVIFEGSGHMIHTEDADAFNSIFERHIRAGEKRLKSKQ